MNSLILVAFATLLCRATVKGGLLDNEKQILADFKARYNNSKSDLLFFMDVSGSVSNYGWAAEKLFVESLLNEISVAPVSTRVVVITFGREVKTDINYIDIDPSSLTHQKCEFKPWFEHNVVHRYGWATNMKDTFLAAANLLQTATNNNHRRQNVHTVSMMITDGHWNTGDPADNANILKNTYESDLFMVGVDRYRRSDLIALASSSNHVLEVPTFTQFRELALFIRGDAYDNVFMEVDSSKCPQLNGCDGNAFCSCGTVSGVYQCVCNPGYYGPGTVDKCYPCPRGSYKRYGSPDDCTGCPANSNTADVGSVSILYCTCNIGYEGDPPDDIPCTAVECERLPTPANGGFLAACGNEYSDVCEFECNTGYILEGTSSRTCQSDKTWSGTTVQCKIVTCSVLPTQSHGTKNCTGIGYEYGDQCSFTCEDGYERQGSSVRTCQANGQWSGSATTCEARQCPALRQLAFGTVSPVDCVTTPQPYTRGCVMTCVAGYTRTGDGLLTCGADGSWNGTYPSCDDIQPPEITCPSVILDGTDLESSTKTITWSDPVVHDNAELHDPNAVPTVVRSPNYITSPYDFPIGTTRITYTATDRSNNSQSCIFTVDISDTEKPKIYCPQNQEIEKSSSNPTVTVYWPAPTYSDNSGQAVTVFTESINGTAFQVGQHLVRYTATDHVGLQSDCTFIIVVSPVLCPAYDPPINGLISCVYSAFFGGDTCTPQCQRNKEFSRVPALFYICLANGVWNPLSFDPQVSREMPWPDCTEEYVPGALQLGMEWQYFSGNCENLTVQNNAKLNFQRGLNAIFGAGDETYCDVTKQCTLENIRIKCGATQARRRRTAQEILTIDVDVTVLTQNNDYQQTKTAFEQNVTSAKTDPSMQSIQISGSQNMTLNIVTNTPVYGVCVNGSVFGLNHAAGHNEKCQNCPAGTFFDLNNGTCMDCPHDTYNPDTAQVGQCTVCPQDTYTVSAGSKNISQCLGACQAGEFSSTGLANCEVCPIDSYQSLTRQTSCVSCPGSSVTLKVASKSISDCGMPCAAGTYSKTGVEPCLPCPKGYYQSSLKQTSCIICDGSTSTYGVGASSLSQCIDIQNCASNPCDNDAQCVEDAEGYKCVCPPGFTGTNCEADENECVISPCVTGATCVDKVNGYLCLCPPEYSGEHCDVKSSSCTSGKCASGSTCVNTPEGHDCTCPDGYEGTFCEKQTNDCYSAPCQNGGTCSIENFSFKCTCPTGYSGNQCEKNDNGCLPDSCLNNATCSDTSYGHVCNCEAGYAGSMCEVNINECSSGPCQNNGLCVDQVNGYTCYCKPSFKGTNCETEVSTDFDMEFNIALGRGASVVEMRQELRAFTVAFWMKASNTSYDPGTPISYAVQVGDNLVDNALVIQDYNGFNIWVMGQKASTNVPANDGNWHHLAFTWQSSTGAWKVYKDGSNVSQSTDAEPLQTGGVIASGGYFVLGQEQDDVGKNFSASEAFIGKLSQLNIWGYELPEQDIADMARHYSSIIGNVVAWSDFYEPANARIVKIEPSDARNALSSNKCWTNWINNDSPTTGTGDTETNADACANPSSYDCQTVDGFGVYDQELNKTSCSSSGIVCLNSEQRSDRTCPDFKVRYVCTCPANTACASNPCGSHGTCQALPVGYKCVCDAGYEGRLCDTAVKCPCTGTIANGNHSGSRLLGGQMTITCNSGFTASGTTTLNCVDGKWDAAVPLCVDVDECTEGTSGCGQNCVNTYGSYLCKCNAGYSLNADGKTCTDINECATDNGHCQQSCHNSVGSYLCTCASGYTLSSDARSCEDTNECSSNGGLGPCEHICVNTLMEHECLCNPGFTLNADGATCQANSCPSISSFENGALDPTTPATTVGSTVSFTCNVGYVLKGASPRTCLADGSWSGNTPRCDVVRCIIPGELKDGTRSTAANSHNTVVSYACNSGFRLVGSATRTCQANGTWSGEHPLCIAADCPEPSVPSNGILIGLQRKNGDTIRYECDVGYAMVGQSYAICVGGAWNAGAPTCNLVNCGTPPSVTDGVISGSDFSYNATITYSCIASNFKLSGSEERTCQADGQWSGTQPVCLENSCGNPGTPENGQKDGLNYQYNDVVTFTCDEGYNLVGSSSRQCQTDGNWDGTQPTCQLISCGDPGTPANGESVGSEYTYGKSITYDCDPGYQLSGTRTRTCQLDGSWSGTVASCSVSQCGAALVGPSGSFSSPDNPNSYPDNAYCRWKITVPSGKKVMVTFNTFKTQANNDVVEIYDGTTTQLITTLSGVYSQAFSFTSESNAIDVRFISDGSVNTEGFSASYMQTTCGGLISQLGEAVMSPNYPSDYPNSVTCVWVINPGQQFQLEFETFHTESGYDFVQGYSSLSSFNRAQDLIFDFDGQRLALPPIEALGGVMYLKFQTNYLNTAPGFKATIENYQINVGK